MYVPYLDSYPHTFMAILVSDTSGYFRDCRTLTHLLTSWRGRDVVGLTSTDGDCESEFHDKSDDTDGQTDDEAPEGALRIIKYFMVRHAMLHRHIRSLPTK